MKMNYYSLSKVYGTDGLLEIMRSSDYLVVALALTAETENFINAEALNEAKPGQILINIARGAVINEDDLIAALEKGHIAGAALDVFMTEPLPVTSKLWEFENVLLSPHNADMTKDFRHNSVKFFTENCARFISGLPLRNIVNPKLGY
jgi:phosphoglycerate dehydrogenase-like enzyme